MADTTERPSFTALLTKFPSFDPAWPPQVIDGWMRCFEQLKAIAEAEDADGVPVAPRVGMRWVEDAVELAREMSRAKAIDHHAAELRLRAHLLTHPALAHGVKGGSDGNVA